MAPIPAPSPAGQSPASLPGNQAGGGQGYIPSGTCSGTAFFHTQTLQVYYEVATFDTPTGAWPPACGSSSALVCTVYGNATEWLGQFSTSAHASGCAGAANAVQGQTMVLSSTTGSVGFGTKGSIYTLSGGYTRKWAVAADVNAWDGRILTKLVFPIEGLPLGWNHDATMSNSVARQLISEIITGGLLWDDYKTPGAPDIATAWTLMDWNLIDI